MKIKLRTTTKIFKLSPKTEKYWELCFSLNYLGKLNKSSIE